jgi:hypothetical protein
MLISPKLDQSTRLCACNNLGKLWSRFCFHLVRTVVATAQPRCRNWKPTEGRCRAAILETDLAPEHSSCFHSKHFYIKTILRARKLQRTASQFALCGKCRMPAAVIGWWRQFEHNAVSIQYTPRLCAVLREIVFSQLLGPAVPPSLNRWLLLSVAGRRAQPITKRKFMNVLTAVLKPSFKGDRVWFHHVHSIANV